MNDQKTRLSGMERVFVTGSMGFLGSEIVRQVQFAGYSCVPSDHPAKIPAERRDVIGFDILDPNQIRGRLQGCSVVIHAAGLAHVFDAQKAKEAPFKTINVDGTLNVAKEALHAGVTHFIFISSVSVYGSASSSFRNEASPCRPTTGYAKSKFEAENELKSFLVGSSMRLTILRLATLYGKGDPGNVAKLIRTIIGNKFLWIGTGNNLKSLIHVTDAARACALCITRRGDHVEIFNVCDAPRTMKSIVRGIYSSIGRPMPRRYIPAKPCIALARFLAGFPLMFGEKVRAIYETLIKWLADDSYDGTKFYRMLSYSNSISLEKGITEETTWIRCGE